MASLANQSYAFQLFFKKFRSFQWGMWVSASLTAANLQAVQFGG